MARKKQSLLNSSIILVTSTIIVKIVGLLYKIPITDTIGLEGLGYFEAAYSIYIPIYSIALAGLPVAISRMVSHYSALGRFRDIKRVQRIAFRLFFISGLLGMIIILLIAYPYSALIVKTPKLFPLLIVLAPSVLMCALMASYRGYYNGLRNMYPSAVSEIVEAAFKAIIGIWLSKLVVKYALSNFNAGNPVFGQIVTSEQEAVVAASPYSAVAAIAGVTISTVLSLAFLVLRHRIVGDKITRDELRAAPRPESSEKIAKKMLAIAMPIVLSSLIFNFTTLIDATTLLNRLDSVVSSNKDIIYSMYADSFSMISVEKESMFLYGAYGIALNFKNILPTLSMTLGVSVIPILTEAWTLGNKLQIKRSIESVLRITMLIALPAGLGMAALAGPIIRLLYNSPEVIAGLPISQPIMIVFGLFAPFIAATQPTISMLQGLGRPDIPLYSTTIGAVLKIAINFVLISIPKINIFGALIGSVVCYVVIVLINYVSLISITKVRLNLIKIFFKPLFSAALCAATAWLTYNGLVQVLDRQKIATLLAIALAVVVYGLALLYTRTITKAEIHMLPLGKKIAPILEKYRLID